MTTLTHLHAIPELAALVFTARATPAREPGSRPKGKRTGSPMPPEVAAWDLLRPDEHGLLHELTQAVRMVWEQQADPRDLDNPPTWAGECGWLIATAPDWQADPLQHEWVRDAVKSVHKALARWVGEHHKPTRLECTKCRGTLAVDHYGAEDHGHKAVACTDCGHIWHPRDLAHEATMQTPATLPDIAARLGVTERTLQRWVAAGIVAPVTSHQPSPRQPALYLPSDCAKVAAMVRAVC